MKKILSYSVCLLLIIACGTSRRADNNKATASTYRHDVNSIHPEFTMFHVNDTISELHYKISSEELLYTRPDGFNFSCNVLISFRLLHSYDSKEVLDSASVRLVDVNNDNASKYLIGKMKVHASGPASYFLRITVNDLNRNVIVSSVMDVDKDNELDRQNFLVRSKATDAPIFHKYIRSGEELLINYRMKTAMTLFVRYYDRTFPLAAPPFSVTEPKPFQYRPDSTFSIQLNKDGVAEFTALKKGFYHFQLDTSRKEGLTLYNFSETFPEIKKAQDLVPPLRFITSRQEYEELSSSTNPKAAVEKFWMNCTGNQDRAKEIIRKYYNRVKDANIYFTSYLEGWKTDRGMIYMIYGAPNVIYRTANAETWTYGEENNINSLSYSFIKVDNPFTDNDYTLERSAVYKQNWGIAVDIWRQGRTYLQD
jgi:GWxTD domain-containing protein